MGKVSTGPDNDRARYRLLERTASSSGQGTVYRAVLCSGDVEGAAAGTVVALKQVELTGLGAGRLEELHAAIAKRRHPALGRQLEVYRGPVLPEIVDEGATEPIDEASGAAGADPGEAPDRREVLHTVAVWVEGQTLTTAAADAAVADILDWTRQVAEALDFLHTDLDGSGPLLHRDIKPANIVVTPEGRAVLIDPGLARIGPSSATGSPYGTPGFIPPECDADPTAGSPASDRWQLAATLVTALAGDPPGWMGSHETIRAALVERCRAEVAQPEALADGVLAMLAVDREARPSSAARWVASLHRAAATGRPRRSPLRTAGRAAALVLAGIVGTTAATTIGLFDDADPDRPGTEPAGAETSADRPLGGPGFTTSALIDTRVTSGPHADNERRAYLSTLPLRFCRARGCEVPGGAVSSGMEVTLTCRVNGERVTNGNDLSATDDDNPILFESFVWFGARIDGGPSGLLSEVWIHPDDRAPRGLPFC